MQWEEKKNRTTEFLNIIPMLNYYRRIAQAYLGQGTSQLSFWHETPEVNVASFDPASWQFYMTFADKARYAGPFDGQGVPLLDYRGRIGRQYNPIAIAQYGLACFNKAQQEERPEAGKRTSDNWLHRALVCADWLVANLEPNRAGLKVWLHKFDWEYLRLLKAPWYSGLAQGQGVALLVHAGLATGDTKYMGAADAAFAPLVTRIENGGCLHIDEAGDWWIEEYITDPSTHILNGFVWALWGVWDYVRATKTQDGSSKPEAEDLWQRGLITIEKNLPRFDCGYWSLYDVAPVGMSNVASSFYHRLHIVQMDVMHRLTGKAVFREYGERWRQYQANRLNRTRSFLQKAAFKLRYY